LIGVFKIAKNPVYNVFMRELLLNIAFYEGAHELEFNYNELGVIFHLVLVLDELPG
jgi:hypothetical protein